METKETAAIKKVKYSINKINESRNVALTILAGSCKGKYQTNHCLSRSRRNSWFHRQALLIVRLWTKYTFEQNGQLQWRTIMNNGISTWRTKMGWMAVCQVRWQLHGYKNNEYWAAAFNNQEKTAYEIIPNILADHWFLWWDQRYGPLEWLSVLQLKNLYQEAAAFLKPERAVEQQEKQQNLPMWKNCVQQCLTVNSYMFLWHTG